MEVRSGEASGPELEAFRWVVMGLNDSGNMSDLFVESK